MFTGLVEECGTVVSIRETPSSFRLTVRCGRVARGLRLGDSVAVNGCCLTLVKRTGRRSSFDLSFDLLQETWKVTSFQGLREGDPVNLERALSMGDRLGGHFVTGHVDAVGKILRWQKSGRDRVLDIRVPESFRPLLVYKGSVAVDGISLTVAAVTASGFRVWIIPHTFEATNLQVRDAGDRVNLEGDLLGKYVIRFLEVRGASLQTRGGS